jgi:hypothetical protein
LQVAAGQPSEYLIYSHRTGEKISVNCGRSCHA